MSSFKFIFEPMSKVILSKEQVEIVLKNICKLRNLKEPEIIYSGKPKWSDAIIQKHNYERFQKFAKNYTIYFAEGNEGVPNEIFIHVEIEKTFEKYLINVCSTLLHLFIDKIDVNIKKPIVSICFSTNIPNKQLVELNTPIFQFPYRFILLTKLYFVCGSKTRIGALTGDYELFPYQESYNKKDYAVIFSNDPLIIAINGLPGELFKYSQLFFDSGVYKTVFIKKIQSIPKYPELPLDVLKEDFLVNCDDFLPND